MSGLTTTAVHAGYKSNNNDGAIIPPLHLSTTFRQGNTEKYEYSRSGNPTRQALEAVLARLDDGRFGLAYSSGSAALANLLMILRSGETVLFSTDSYGGTYRYITRVASVQGVSYRAVDLTDLEAVKKTLKDQKVRLIWVETPTNPLLKVVDIAALAELAHRHNALIAVDNTFASPVLQRPLAHGADIVAYSTTKYINGHSDSVGGALILNDKTLYSRLKFLQNAVGAILSPFDSWLTLRGLRTLELRMQRHSNNALALANFLQAHPKIKRVYYPGLFVGEQGRIVAKQMSLPGGIVSVETNPGVNIKKMLAALEYFPLAESLGGVESLIDHPASMTHAALPKAERQKIGLSDQLFRVSVGIENSEDLLADINHALSQA